MSVSPSSAEKPQNSIEISSQPTHTAIGLNGSPKILTNLILKLPPQSQDNLDVQNFHFGHQLAASGASMPLYCPLTFDKYESEKDFWRRKSNDYIKQEEDARVKGKLIKKGKRDGENIRTYARYDSVIQALQQELSKHHIVPTSEDNKMLDQFEMKSKRSLQRIFFYLLLAKRQNKLHILLPDLKLKIRAKVQQKGGHRTQQFLNSLQNCIEKYIDAAQKLQQAKNIEQAKTAFSIAYLSDLSENGNQKRPHHNKIKGIENCLEIYRIIIQKQGYRQQMVKLETQPEQNVKQLIIKQQINSDLIKKLGGEQMVHEKKLKKKLESCRMQDESFNVEQDQLLENPNEKKKKLGIKNKKQDDRDIQKYAKFDIVSESSLQFLKMQKLHKNIPQVCKKLSQRSLHFFFVILAMIQKQKKDADFLAHLQDNYERKVQKRYSQRSQYFRQRLHKSFFNLIQATRALFQGRLDDALDIAYEVKSQKKTHPAKASQQKKCREIYEAISSSFVGSQQQNKLKLELLIQRDKGYRSQLIKQIKCPTSKTQALKDLDKFKVNEIITGQRGIQMGFKLPSFNPECKVQQQQSHRKQLLICDQIQRQATGIVIPIPLPHRSLEANLALTNQIPKTDSLQASVIGSLPEKLEPMCQ